MLCPNCGKEIAQESRFCAHCGKETGGELPLGKQTPGAETCQPAGSAPSGNAVVYFCPNRKFGQFLLRKATIEISNQIVTTKVKKASKLIISPGKTDIFCYGNYLGKCGKVQKSFVFESGTAYIVKCRSPLVVFMSGKLVIRPVEPKEEEKLLRKCK